MPWPGPSLGLCAVAPLVAGGASSGLTAPGPPPHWPSAACTLGPGAGRSSRGSGHGWEPPRPGGDSQTCRGASRVFTATSLREGHPWPQNVTPGSSVHRYRLLVGSKWQAPPPSTGRARPPEVAAGVSVLAVARDSPGLPRCYCAAKVKNHGRKPPARIRPDQPCLLPHPQDEGVRAHTLTVGTRHAEAAGARWNPVRSARRCWAPKRP